MKIPPCNKQLKCAFIDVINIPPTLLLSLCPPSDLIQCTNEMNVNIPELADTLFERTANTSWVVVFKSLTTTHHLMVYGNEVRTALRLFAESSLGQTPNVLFLFCFFFSCRDLYSIWLPGTHYSTSIIF